jgi:aminoglycoside 3-N-acetyltransferase I
MDYELLRLKSEYLNFMRLLNALFADVFDDNQSYAAQPPSDEYLRLFLADERHIVLVAKQAGQVIGGLVAYHLPKFERERSEVYVYDLAVSSDHQRHGIGKALMTEIRNVARDLGAYVVFVQADTDDDAVEFYRALKPNDDIMTRNFDFNVE